jgi:endoglucanase
MSDPGYRLIDALVACTRGTPVPEDLLSFVPTNYYPSTLHLLGLSYLASRGGTCG